MEINIDFLCIHVPAGAYNVISNWYTHIQILSIEAINQLGGWHLVAQFRLVYVHSVLYLILFTLARGSRV